MQSDVLLFSGFLHVKKGKHFHLIEVIEIKHIDTNIWLDPLRSLHSIWNMEAARSAYKEKFVIHLVLFTIISHVLSLIPLGTIMSHSK